ncbi:MAG: hypothetical protein CO127_08475 [Ignavibacteria bacterium CG_4_9_14_3_um_filter_36_18]|nr:T9SS type A sorting domain-containing protein [Ignavibacteria bacterium]PJB00410.1 MAG: hypothetical protein CO127_08475 [Ignavibacteria bacterium CG_4_9_14_3_um_filter_36_18]
MTRTGVGTLLPWNPDITSPYFGVSTKVTGVTSLLLTDGVVYAGGYFTAVGGVARINLAAIDKATGLATTWDPHPADGENTFVNSISLMGNNVFAGGAFFSVNGVNRNCLAAVDLSTKQVTSWDPNVTLTGGGAIVSSMVEYGPNIYLSGAFDMIGGIPRGKFAAISKTTGLPVDFLSTTIFNYPVPYTLAVNNDKLYISGAFSTIGDSVRNNVASVDLITGNVTAWNPSLDIAGSSYYVRAFGFAGSTVYLSGDFETVGISFRKGLAAVDDTLGSVLPWNPNAGNGYTGFGFHGFAMDVSNSIVYVGGNFDTVGTTGRRGLAAIDAITGDVTAWNAELTVPLFTLGITSLKVAGSNLYIGGALTSVGANPRTAGIAAIDIPTATANSWNPQLGRPINPLTGTIFSFVLDGTNSLMYIAGNFTIINSDDPCYKFASIPIPAVIPTTFQLTVTVGDGWNMVSVPGVNPNGQGVENWWAGRIGNVYKYSAGYQVITTTTPGEGYWMKNNGNQTYNTGNEWPAGGIQYVPYDPISVVAGWNMLGGYDYNAAVSGITPAPQGSFYGFSGTGGYQAVTELVAGYGYWAKFASAGQITLPPPLFKGTSTVAKVIDDSWGKITITDNAGKNYTLYGISGEVDLNNYELPPLPPSGLFDIRYGSSRYAENLSAGQQTIQMQGIEYPVRIKVEGMRIQLQDAGGKIVNVSLSSGEELTIANNLVNKLVILSGEVTATLPIEYALEQNYPNPFNPSTSVQFLVPKEGLVTIKVYDMLGQEVATLFSGNAQGGTYTSNWNGKDNSGNFVSSGTYIYRMTVGDFTQSRKMLFLK